MSNVDTVLREPARDGSQRLNECQGMQQPTCTYISRYTQRALVCNEVMHMHLSHATGSEALVAGLMGFRSSL